MSFLVLDRRYFFIVHCTVQYLYTITQYTRYTLLLLQQRHNCNTVRHKLYILNQVTVQYQYTIILYNTNLLYRTTANMYIVYTFLYTHTQEFTHYLYIHLKYITVHRTFSDTTVQHDSCTLRLLLKQYTFLGNSTQYTLD